MTMLIVVLVTAFFFFKQKTAYEMRISDWSSDVCSSDLAITSIETSYFNGQQIRERGIDFELSYRTPVDRLFSGASGSLLLRGLANYVDRYSLSQGPGLPDIDKAGEVGAPGSGSTGVFAGPQSGRESCRERVCQYG